MIEDPPPRVWGAHLDHVGTYVCWGTDKGGPYCRGSYQGYQVKVYVSEFLEMNPKGRAYVEVDVRRRLLEHR